MEKNEIQYIKHMLHQVVMVGILSCICVWIKKLFSKAESDALKETNTGYVMVIKINNVQR